MSPAPASALMQNRWGFILFMSAMCTLSPFAMSFIVPSFPGMADEFNKPVAEIQLMISAFLVGLGLAQPIHGLLADRYGRRPVLIAGFVIFLIASAASVMTASWMALVTCRFFQAVGVSAGTVTSRAIINDAQPRHEAAITLSYVSIAMGVGPILAPIFGGVLDQMFGWRSIFIGCAIAGVLILALAIPWLPETRPKSGRAVKTLKATFSDYGRLLSSGPFLGYTVMFGAGQGLFFAFLPFAPDYFENVLGQSKTVFIVSWVALSLAFMTGSLMGTRFVKRFGMDTAIARASIWFLASTCLIALVFFIFGDGVVTAILPLMIALLGTGVICPLALTGSISFNPQMAGAASGLSSSIGLIIGGMFAVVSGVLYDGTLLPYVGLAILAALCNLFALKLTHNKNGSLK